MHKFRRVIRGTIEAKTKELLLQRTMAGAYLG